MSIKSERTAVVYRCDRCGDEGESTKATLPSGWNRISTSRNVAGHGSMRDLCAECAADFCTFMSSVREETS